VHRPRRLLDRLRSVLCAPGPLLSSRLPWPEFWREIRRWPPRTVRTAGAGRVTGGWERKEREGQMDGREGGREEAPEEEEGGRSGGSERGIEWASALSLLSLSLSLSLSLPPSLARSLARSLAPSRTRALSIAHTQPISFGKLPWRSHTCETHGYECALSHRAPSCGYCVCVLCVYVFVFVCMCVCMHVCVCV